VDLLISGGIFAFILTISMIVLSRGRRGRERTRVRELLGEITRDKDDQRAQQLIRVDPRHRAKGSAWFAAITHLKPLQRLEQMLWQAGLYLHISEMLLIMVLAAGAGLAAAVGVGRCCSRVPLGSVWALFLSCTSGGGGSGGCALSHYNCHRRSISCVHPLKPAIP
jgi:hypothetical protein